MAPSMTSAGSGQFAWMSGSSWVPHHSFQMLANSAGWGLGVGVGGGGGVGTGVDVGGGGGVGVGVEVGLGVAVGSSVGVAVGSGVGNAVGSGVAVGTVVAVGAGVFVGAVVAVGGVVGSGVAVGSSLGHPANIARVIRNGMRTRTLGLASQDCTIQLPLTSTIPCGAGSKTSGVGSAPTLTNPQWLCQCIWSTSLALGDVRATGDEASPWRRTGSSPPAPCRGAPGRRG